MFKKILCILLPLCLLLSGCGSRYEKYQSEFSGLFDTVTVIVGYAKSEAEFTRYAEIIYQRMEELDHLYDIYNAYDGLNNVYSINQNAGIAPVEADRDIIDMLLFAKEGFTLTEGTVNIAMGSVLKIWHDYRKAGIADEDTAILPPMDALLAAASITDIDDLVIDETNNTVFLRKPGMSLDVGAVAKGYAARLAVKAAQDAGMSSAILNAGGNIISVGKPQDNVRARWGIGIQDPDLSIDGTRNIIDTVYVNDAAITCSGDYQRFYVVDGENYHHIIDPVTLMPSGLYKEVTVIHTDSSMADLLSTALFIMPQARGAELAERMQADVLWIYKDGTQEATEGYKKISKNLGNYSAVDTTEKER